VDKNTEFGILEPGWNLTAVNGFPIRLVGFLGEAVNGSNNKD
jgi:hypothetical protein